MNLVKPDGRIVSGIPCIYHLPNGITFFSEAVKEDGDSYIFDPEKTLCLLIGPIQPNNTQHVGHVRGFGPGIPFIPSYLRVGKAGVIVTDCTDPKIIALWKAALSGIVLAGPGAMPGEKVN